MAEGVFDVAILGAGPVGCALALGLTHAGLSVALVTRPRAVVTEPAASGVVQTVALSYGSRLILERLGVWNELETTKIERIHVSQAGGFGRTWISREDMELPALGYVTAYDPIAPSMTAILDATSIHWLPAGTPPEARLVVHAEGSPGQEAFARDYRHTAIVATVSSERPSHGVAWERFTSEGPLALLPFGGGYSVVWCRAPAAAAESMRLSDGDFLLALQSAFGLRAGRFLSTERRTCAPLALRYRRIRAAAGEIHIGNAAQTLHPVAGQGLNLGLRDAWDLAELLVRTPREEHGSVAFAKRFSSSRQCDARGTIRTTDLLATLNSRSDPVSATLRSAVLAGFDIFPAARRVLARRMIYGPGRLLARIERG